jgi:hypothetical protein
VTGRVTAPPGHLERRPNLAREVYQVQQSLAFYQVQQYQAELYNLTMVSRDTSRDYLSWSAAPSPEAEQKSLALLKRWLSPEQRAEYEVCNRFEVVGSDTGTRYVIHCDKTQMNIYEAGSSRRWCFLPEGNLAAGDIFLTQKIALETNELETLRVAHMGAVVPPGGECLYRRFDEEQSPPDHRF